MEIGRIELKFKYEETISTSILDIKSHIALPLTLNKIWTLVEVDIQSSHEKSRP
jgi:hypothetical protein